MSRLASERGRIQGFVISITEKPKLFLMVVFLFALALRLVVMLATSSYHIKDYGDDHFSFGWEMGRVARSLAEGHGFSSPLPLPTGPTAIVGPIYPLLLASVFKLFGVYSKASAITILVVQGIFASLTCVFVYLCGRDSVGKATGMLAALLWAVFPLNIFFATTKIWETSLSAMLAAVIFWWMLSLRDSLSAWRWAMAGGLLAVAALLNTSLAVLVIPFGLSALWRQRTRIVWPATAAALTFWALLFPWLLRNHYEFGRFMLRSNFPLEFRVCNNEWSPGQKLEDMHPSMSPYLNQHWHDVGEMRFMAEERDLNSQYLATNGGLFAFSILNRAINYWTGGWVMSTADFPNNWPVIMGTSLLSLVGLLGIRRMFYDGNPAAFMYAGCLLLYPVVYYVTTSQPRFYHAITPLLIVPGSFWLLTWKNRILAALDGRRGSSSETVGCAVDATSGFGSSASTNNLR